LAPTPGRLLGRKAAEGLGGTLASRPEDDILGAPGARHAHHAQGGKTRFLTGSILGHTMQLITGVEV